jgi:hypothetical protein
MPAMLRQKGKATDVAEAILGPRIKDSKRRSTRKRRILAQDTRLVR